MRPTAPHPVALPLLFPSGWWHVNVTSTPAKIQDAMMASLNVLRNVRLQPITQVGRACGGRVLNWANVLVKGGCVV